MQFTYTSYRRLIQLLKREEYSIVSFNDYNLSKKCVILRHDIDTDISKAVTFSELEKEEGVASTYFVLVTSQMYNIFAKESIKALRILLDNGHDIGLHFDETQYSIRGDEELIDKIMYEKMLLEHAIDRDVITVSMHRPSKRTLESNLAIPGMINSYSSTFFSEFKYFSDSRRRWREPIIDLIKSEAFPRMQILTHAFWYNNEEKTLHDTIKDFINTANRDRYFILNENISDFESIISIREIL